MEKERRTKALLLSTLVVVVATLSIAFAAMSRTLSINGIGKMDTASWSVYFNDLKGPTIVRGAKQVSAPSISDDKGIVQDINVQLSNPKDEISYTVDIVNDGTIDAEITMIKDVELTDVQKKVFEFKVTYTDTGEVLKDGDILPKDTTKNITINIKFKDDITEADLPTESQTINLSYQVTYTQYDGGGAIVGPNGGEENLKQKSTVKKSFLTGSSIKAANVESINFISELRAQDNAIETWDASAAGDNSVIGFYTDIDSNGLYEVYIGGTNGVYAPENCSQLFGGYLKTKQINFNGNFDTSKVTNMISMFNNCQSLTDIIFDDNFDTSNVTNMANMFSYCKSLTSLDLSSFNTSNVTIIVTMMQGCSSLINLNLDGFDFRKSSGYGIFLYNCNNLISISLNNTKFSKPGILTLFQGAKTSLEIVSMKNVQVSGGVTSFSDLFQDFTKLKKVDMQGANISTITNTSGMFSGCTSLNEVIIDGFDLSIVTTKTNMFLNVPENFTIYVKDEASRDVVQGLRSDANVIIGAPAA